MIHSPADGIAKRVVQALRHRSDVSRGTPRVRGSLIDGQTFATANRSPEPITYFMKLRTSCEMLISRGIEREVACIEDVDLRLRHVAAIGLRF